MVVMNFWRVRIDLVFKSFFEMIFFLFFKKIVPHGYIIGTVKWTFILMDFMSFSFRIFKMISPYQLTTIFFNMGFDLVLKGFISD